MNVPPILLLCLGCTFALLYGALITLGWARTRRNRRIIQTDGGFTMLPLYDVDAGSFLEGQSAGCVSLTRNQFTAPDGTPLDPSAFIPCIAAYSSENIPAIKAGDLLLLDPTTNRPLYAFPLPSLASLR